MKSFAVLFFLTGIVAGAQTLIGEEGPNAPTYEGEPVVLVDDLKGIAQVVLPTPYVRPMAGSQYEFILNFESGFISEAPSAAGQPVHRACVGERIQKIEELLERNQLCDFSTVKEVRSPEVACLTVVYPNYMLIPLIAEGAMLGIGAKVDSCAIPQQDLCNLADAQDLRAEVEALTTDFMTQIESGRTDGQCL